jgi:hypothetical protein
VAELTLEPFAARLRWTLPAGGDAQTWSEIVAGYLEVLAGRCVQSGPCVIGHIKAFAPLPGGYLRANVTRAGVAADVEAHASEPCRELSLALNVLVYGLPAETLASLTTGTATEVASDHGAAVMLMPSHEHS